MAKHKPKSQEYLLPIVVRAHCVHPQDHLLCRVILQIVTRRQQRQRQGVRDRPHPTANRTATAGRSDREPVHETHSQLCNCTVHDQTPARKPPGHPTLNLARRARPPALSGGWGRGCGSSCGDSPGLIEQRSFLRHKTLPLRDKKTRPHARTENDGGVVYGTKHRGWGGDKRSGRRSVLTPCVCSSASAGLPIHSSAAATAAPT